MIACARRQDVYIVALADLLRNESAGVLGTRAHVGAVSRRDEGEFH
jgi:hypothetical protein